MTAWSRRGYVTSGGGHIQHENVVREFVEVVKLPAAAALINIKAHRKMECKEQQGNMLADQAARNTTERAVPQTIQVAALGPGELNIKRVQEESGTGVEIKLILIHGYKSTREMIKYAYNALLMQQESAASDEKKQKNLTVCTKDGRVLIAISKDLTLPPVNLTTVHLKDGHGAECSPTVASVDTVLFEFALTECGTSQRLDGVDVVYETDVLAQFEILDGALGSVSRDSPFRLHVQCSYKGSQESELQLKPRVYTLSPPLPATETGILLLELRIARDAAYRSWYVASDYPILSVLREPVFVEVRVLNRNDPSLVLVLNECWASPTAEPYSQLQWKLLVNRCPFTGDNYKSRLLPLDAASHLRFPTHHKRFVVSTFTFWERVSGRPLSGEVYFHCSAEVCSPSSRENCTASCSPMRQRSTNNQPGTLVTTGPIIFLEDGERLSAGIQQEEKDAAVDSPSHVLPGVAVGVALFSVALLVGTVAVWKMDVAHRVGSECRSMEL
ncbi:zona pellucida sperm-binding protein 4-like [Heterodontus francisci]|uniref:zona pellucida sperm-binding protein 4-like n=1 Tax=Heterodontus francisci TaxID=7792 RepID=UPI00355BA1DF